MNKRIKNIVAVCLLIAGAALIAAIYLIPIQFSSDGTADDLWRQTVLRMALSIAVAALAVMCDMTSFFRVNGSGLGKKLIWILPCAAVALANFPYSALITGDAAIDRPDLIWPFLLKCLFIAVSEEMLFRGILFGSINETFKGRHRYLTAVIASSAIFSLFHLFNLLEGAGLAPTLLQVGYTFLTGLMFACVTDRTGNIWWAVALHFIFDVGGLIVTDIGHGPFQDTCFWVLTIIAAAICAVHLIIYSVKRDREETSPPEK